MMNPKNEYNESVDSMNIQRRLVPQPTSSLERLARSLHRNLTIDSLIDAQIPLSILLQGEVMRMDPTFGPITSGIRRNEENQSSVRLSDVINEVFKILEDNELSED
jgi:hypothetical protein